MAKYFLDTTVLFDHVHGRREAAKLITGLANQGHRLGLCCINVAEVYSGLSQEERSRADRLIDTLDFFEVTRETAKQAGRYRYYFARRGTPLATVDTLIAATAIAEGATLITANTKDFPMEEIQVVEHP